MSYEPTKIFKFTWIAGEDTDYYQLMEYITPDATPQQIGGDLPAGTHTYSHVVSLYKRRTAQYVLRACNSGGCTDSDRMRAFGNLVQSIGYFKASNTGTNDEFGKAVALSSDGKTLAVGAYHEDNALGGINGSNETDNSATNSGAVYVYVLKDKTWEKQAYIKAASPEKDADFGTTLSLSADGNTLVVGARSANSTVGSVYVFTRSENTWIQSQKLSPTDGMVNNFNDAAFGHSVSISAQGNTIAVGATGINDKQGQVFVFNRNNDNSWSQVLQPLAPASGKRSNDLFGSSVSLSADGTKLAIGAIGQSSISLIPSNTDVPDAGAVYIFILDGAEWRQDDFLKAATVLNTSGDQFGYRVSLSDDGNILAVGAPFEDGSTSSTVNGPPDDNANDSGATYIFEKTPEKWQRTYLKLPTPVAGDLFGFSVALSGDGNTLLVGARDESADAMGVENATAGTLSKSGAAYVFTKTNGTWSLASYLKAPNPDANDAFGRSVAISSDTNTIAVGATGEQSNATLINGDQTDDSKDKAGAVYLY